MTIRQNKMHGQAMSTFLEACSMPQAGLRGYFLKDYKGGGVFEHEAYEHDADEWCWIHKSSGIKARPSQFDACRVVTT